MARIELEGTIVCVHHVYSGTERFMRDFAPGLNTKLVKKGEDYEIKRENLGYSVLDIRVGRREMRIIRPMTKRFEWQPKVSSESDQAVKSGDKIRIILEVKKGDGGRE